MGNYTRWYRVGNVKLVNGSRTIEGTDTYWLTAGLNPGDLFTIDGAQFYEVDSIADNTHLTLKNTYGGVSVNDSQYSIIRNFTATMPADIAARTAQLLGDFRKYIDTDMRSIHGQSAYELALENGYTGTEQQWLESLKAAGEWSSLRTEVSNYENATDNRVTTVEGRSSTNATNIGTMTSLITSAKSDMVSAVNEVKINATTNATNIGAMTSLTTDAKGTLVEAVNELDKRVHYLRKWWDGATGWNSLNTTISNLRNTQFRGKCIGEKPTAAQWDAIQKGTFEDMYIGDYWSGGGGWQIIHFNYYRDCCWYFYNRFLDDKSKARLKAQVKQPTATELWESSPNHVVVMYMGCDIEKLSYADSEHNQLAISHKQSQLYTALETQIWEDHWDPVFGPYTTAYGRCHLYSGLEVLEQCDSSGYPSGYVHEFPSLVLPRFEQIFGYKPPCMDGKVYNPVSGGNAGAGGIQADSPTVFAYFQVANVRRDYWGSPMYLRNFGGPSDGKQTIWAIPKFRTLGYRANAVRTYLTDNDGATCFRPYTCIAGGSDMGVL